MKLLKRIISAIFRKTSKAIYKVFLNIPYFHFVKNTKENQNHCSFSLWFAQKILGFNKEAYWPVHYTSRVRQSKSILLGVDTCPGIEPGCYIQGMGKIYIGDYTQIAQNVGIITSNHDPHDLRKKNRASVSIGNYCWLGMNSVVLPGVKLGDFTIVGAGAVVTKSFEEGYCVIGGSPAKVIKKLDKDLCNRHEVENKYVGYLRKEEFESFKDKSLWI